MRDNYKQFQRQFGIVRPSQLQFPIVVVGAGGIGSWTTLALAKMGCTNITVVDPDRVEEKNTPSQIYTKEDIGLFKVAALHRVVLQLTGIQIGFATEKFEQWYPLNELRGEVIVVSVDSLEARRRIWKTLKGVILFFGLLIDARMAGELLRIIAVTPFPPQTVERYEKTLTKNKIAHKEPCTQRAVVYNTFLCGGFIANTVKKYATKESFSPNMVFDITHSQLFA